jgi:hypothetical protein
MRKELDSLKAENEAQQKEIETIKEYLELKSKK